MKKPTIDPAEIYFLQHGTSEGGPPHEHLKWELFERGTHGDRWTPTWEEIREEVMAAWIKNHPGTRCWAWWEIDAPKEAVPGWDHERWDSAQRRRLGGTGTPTHEVLGSWAGFTKGIPDSWVDQSQVNYYNGRAKDIHGNIIPTKYKDGDFKGVAIDPDDPPRFESEAAYLDRHALLTAPESHHIEKHPELMNPEKIE